MALFNHAPKEALCRAVDAADEVLTANGQRWSDFWKNTKAVPKHGPYMANGSPCGDEYGGQAALTPDEIAALMEMGD